MTQLSRSATGHLATPQDPILQRRYASSSLPAKNRFRLSKRAEGPGQPDTFVAAAAKGKRHIGAMVANGVSSMLKRQPRGFQLVGVDEGALRNLASRCGDAAVTYNEVMAFLGGQGYEEFMTDAEGQLGGSVLTVVMRRTVGGRADAPAGLQPSHAFVRRLPFRSCVTY